MIHAAKVIEFTPLWNDPSHIKYMIIITVHYKKWKVAVKQNGRVHNELIIHCIGLKWVFSD